MPVPDACPHPSPAPTPLPRSTGPKRSSCPATTSASSFSSLELETIRSRRDSAPRPGRAVRSRQSRCSQPQRVAARPTHRRATRTTRPVGVARSLPQSARTAVLGRRTAVSQGILDLEELDPVSGCPLFLATSDGYGCLTVLVTTIENHGDGAGGRGGTNAMGVSPCSPTPRQWCTHIGLSMGGGRGTPIPLADGSCGPYSPGAAACRFTVAVALAVCGRL
jgi:hypothetical protein